MKAMMGSEWNHYCPLEAKSSLIINCHVGCSYPGCIWKSECGSALERGHSPLERGWTAQVLEETALFVPFNKTPELSLLWESEWPLLSAASWLLLLQ